MTKRKPSVPMRSMSSATQMRSLTGQMRRKKGIDRMLRKLLTMHYGMHPSRMLTVSTSQETLEAGASERSKVILKTGEKRRRLLLEEQLLEAVQQSGLTKKP